MNPLNNNNNYDYFQFDFSDNKNQSDDVNGNDSNEIEHTDVNVINNLSALNDGDSNNNILAGCNTMSEDNVIDAIPRPPKKTLKGIFMPLEVISTAPTAPTKNISFFKKIKNKVTGVFKNSGNNGELNNNNIHGFVGFKKFDLVEIDKKEEVEDYMATGKQYFTLKDFQVKKKNTVTNQNSWLELLENLPIHKVSEESSDSDSDY